MRLDLFEEVDERRRIVAGLVHVLQAQVVGFGFESARERQEAQRDRQACALPDARTRPSRP